MRFTSKLKPLGSLLALCSSSVMALHLYLVRIFEEQCTGTFYFDFTSTSNDFVI